MNEIDNTQEISLQNTSNVGYLDVSGTIQTSGITTITTNSPGGLSFGYGTSHFTIGMDPFNKTKEERISELEMDIQMMRNQLAELERTLNGIKSECANEKFKRRQLFNNNKKQ